jgi:transposase
LRLGRNTRGRPSKKKARREGRTILFLDETGHSFRARPGTTWAEPPRLQRRLRRWKAAEGRRGLTPVLQRLSKRREVSSIVAATPAGQLYARHFRSSISSELVIQALRHFRRKIGSPLLVVWDRLNAHRARRTAAFLAAHPRDFAVAYLPAYAPDPNPEELCNARVKRALENALPADVADLHRRARREFRRLQHRPDLIVGCFRHAGLSVAQLP